jgi:hypothetical protein
MPVGATATVQITDTTGGDFAAGTTTSAYISSMGDGEVILASPIEADFTGQSLPSDWSSNPWDANGTSAVANQMLTVDGASVYPATMLSGPSTLEFAATFGSAAFQHVGFGVTLNEPLWAIFSTGSGGALYARTNNGDQSTDTVIPGSWAGAAHTYRIEWSPAAVAYFIDGAPVAQHAIAIAAPMRPIASDFTSGGDVVAVRWLHAGPYVPSGAYLSRVFDGGGTLDWTVAWDADVPAGASAAISVRAGGTPSPDATWSGFTPVAASGGPAAAHGRYVQYRIDLSTSGTATPAVRSVTVSGSPSS